MESLAKEIWMQHYIPIIGKSQVDYMLDKYQSYDAISNDISNGYIYYIAFLDDLPCGYSAVKQQKGIFLSKFYVKKSFRGKGVGKAMMKRIFTYTKEQHMSRIWLTCNKNNTVSIDVYKTLGFSIIDECVTDIGKGYVMDDYVLEKIVALL